jgi:hypothetical protein
VSHDLFAEQYLAEARAALFDGARGPMGLAWLRGSALLVRRALEETLADWYSQRNDYRGSGAMAVQLAVLRALKPDWPVADLCGVWGWLSEACHYDDLEPPAEGIAMAADVVEQWLGRIRREREQRALRAIAVGGEGGP